MLRVLLIWFLGVCFLALVSGTVAHSASMTGAARMLGAGSYTVAHCKLIESDAAQASATIQDVTLTVLCNQSGTYVAYATVVSGATSSQGQTAYTVTANTPKSVTIEVPNVPTSGASSYSITYQLKAQ
ncbi:MAG: hypothetical protein HY681_05575 [Chloroflexi bacterium]|nr:hypothetical protein [Chloroflexota bacterium]